MDPEAPQSLEQINRALAATRRRWEEEMDPAMRRRKATARWTVRVGILVQGLVGAVGLWAAGQPRLALGAGVLCLLILAAAVVARRTLPD
ncbi:MAG: hypothetical protein K9K66_09980 [Desulfarculaceae bacterium]|nr:hypothetical protein [Desulfarculaceae bacterium]MCF8073737.1 hypothetical protein [Desulfarculaceae bacterium]MCF8101978.1 hypothetical protein [Desulfarculaceae bacterium]MCF8115948.1 hypothetical protein [Desulfarculaceae bacterium]